MVACTNAAWDVILCVQPSPTIRDYILCKKASKLLHTDLTMHFVTHVPAYTVLVLLACQQQLCAGAGSCTWVTTLSLLKDISARQLPVHARMACWGCALWSSIMLLTMPTSSGSLTCCFASGFIMLTCAIFAQTDALHCDT